MMRLGMGNFGLGGRKPLKWNSIQEGGTKLFSSRGNLPQVAWGQYRLMEESKEGSKKKKKSETQAFPTSWFSLRSVQQMAPDQNGSVASFYS